MNTRFTRPFDRSYENQYADTESDIMYLYSEGTYLLKSCYRYLIRRQGVSRRLYRYGLLLVILLLFSVLLKAANFPVTNTNDAGPGSLRQAMLDVNAAGAGAHSIVFNVYGQITILSSLPQITKDNVTIDGGNKITINSNGSNQIINPFNIRANNVTVRNFRLTNNGDVDVVIQANTTGIFIENIVTSSNTGNFLNAGVYVAGASTNLTLRKITITDIEPCGGDYPYYYGRAIIFVGGTQTNLVMDSITVNSQGNARGCEAVTFRDASINGWTFTNSNISGVQNAVLLDNTGGPVETANNVLLNNIKIDSVWSGVALGIYSDFVNTNIEIRNTVVDLNVVTSADDGDYPIRFDNTTNGVTIDSVTVKDQDIYGIWFNGVAQNISINHTKVTDPTPGDGYVGQFVRFESTVNTLSIKNTILDADKLNTTDDAEIGLVFIAATTGVTLDSLTVNEFDVDGVYVAGASTNFQLNNSQFTSNFDGIEFYNNVPRSNVDIVNSLFKGAPGNRSGIALTGANATTDIDLTGDTVINNSNHGIWLYGGTAATDIMISGCVIRENGGAGIFNDDPDKVVYTANSIYNNITLGIDNVAGNCGYQNPANVPVLVSSTPMGGGQYQLVINLPATVPAGYTVDIYANDLTTSPSSGQYFVTSLTGLNSGSNTRTITYNTGPGATGAGFWTATLRIPANNCGTSEFSDRIAISTQGPGNVDANVKLWLRADATLTNNTTLPTTEGQVVNRWGDFSQGGAPNGVTSFGTVTYKKAGINFNPAGYFAGAVMQAATANTWLNSANVTSFAVFNKYTAATDGSRVFVVYDNASGGYDYNTNAESIIFGRAGANIQTHRNGWENPVIPNALGKPGLFTSVTNSAAHAMYYNGVSQGAAAYNKGNLNAEQWFVGGGYAAGWCCTTTSDVAEIITFDRELTATEISQVHSYLAIKYGITMPVNYVASDGTTLTWNATTNAGYGKHITGIGRDDLTFLHQKQSLSADTGIVTLALGDSIMADNASNANLINADKSFLVFGDNGATITYTTVTTGTYVNMRMARIFKVQKTNWTDQNITLRVQGAGASNYLLISTDPTFATITQELPLSGTGTITIPSSMLANGVYFTIGANLRGPAAVNAGIALWLRADDGNATGALWGDFSGSGNGAAQHVAASQATVLPAGVNFNPALKFDGTNDFLRSPSIFTPTGVNNLQVYAVTITDVVQAHSIFGELVSNGQQVLAHIPWSDGILYFDAPYGYRAQGAWGGTLGTPYLWSFVKSLSAMSASRNRTTVASYTAAMGNIAGSNNPFNVGSYNGGGYFNGKIAEMIVYNNSVATTTTQRQQIESYLALKYGITLSQTPATDYLASDGSVYWSASVNGIYNKHITGIGRDSVTALNQKQSLSVDTGYVTMALGSSIAATNAANTSIITNNKSFFVFGDNGGAKAFTNTVTGLTDVNITLGRVWKVQKTNWADQDITLRTDSTLPAPQYLIVSTDATFGAGDLVLPVTNRTITLNTNQLPNGAWFTFGNTIKAPGNVTAGIAAWWRADVEASATKWSDYSGNGKTLTQTATIAQPALLPVHLNYQPVVKFHNTAWYNSASLFGTASTNDIAIFSVSAADGGGANGTGGSGLFSEYVSNGDRIAAWAPYGDGRIYFYPPAGWSVASASPLIYYAIPRFNILGFTKAPTQLNIYFNHTTVGTANGTYTGINGNNQPFYLGAYNGPDYFNGRIAEFVVYNNSSAMTATDRLKIQSYLALKYGITISPATPTDYLASDGTTKMWTAADNTGYGRRITGLGRDDADSLNQKQSLSVDTGLVTIALGNAVAISNAANTATITNDKSFFVFSDNGAAAGYLTTVSGINGVNNRMTRIFKADKTNWSDQDITLKLNGGNAQTYLLVSADAIFGAGDAAYVLNADSTVTLNSSNLPDGAYFTFATFIKGPNAITKGLNFWLRADDGNTSGSLWNDYSGYQHNAGQPVVSGQPVTDAKGINFNYSLKFDGADDFLDINTTRVHPDSATIFVAASGSGFPAGRDLVSSGAVGGNQGMEFRVVNPGALQYLENSASVVAVTGPGGFVENRPYLFSVAQSNVANGTKLYQNFKLDNQGTITLSPATPNLVSIGSRTIAARGLFWQGNVSEVIVYDRVLPDAERQSVESYLGLKYGITLNNGATNYLASDNTPYWTADAIYKSRITGIGRDDSTALNTKQSLSADTGFVTLSLGSGVPLTNELNTGTITSDRSFFVFADNGLSATNFTIAVTGSANNVVRRMARVWKVNKTNWTDQDITLKIIPIGIDNHLLISSDPTFATFTQELPVTADGTITLSSALFTTTDLYFTFGAPLKSPGGVAGHAMWVRADIGTSTSADNTALQEWSDFSAFNNNPTQATPANQPTFLNNQSSNINFNPVVRFNGSTIGMTAASILKTGTYNSMATFAVVNQATAAASVIWTEPAGVGTQVTLHATWSDNVVYWDPPFATNRLTYNAGDVNNQSILWSATSDISLAANRQSIFRNGMNAANGNGTGQYVGNNSTFRLGQNGATSFNGRMAEVIIYTTALTPVQQQQVNTYMALKYGITLNNGNTSYLATDATTIWDATANAACKKNIAGIGRDDEEALQQKQSRSINTGFQVTIGLGSIDSTNAANPNAFMADKSYLIWGDDSTATAFVTAVSGHSTINYRMTRVWKVQETGTVGNVLIAIPGNTIPSTFSSPSLVVSADATFDGSDTYIPLTQTTINGASYYTASADLINGQYFSFAALVAAPGGVLGEALWVKADAGVEANTSSQVQQWFDQSGNGAVVSELRAATLTHADPITPSADIAHVPNGINFNPSLDFTGAVNKSLKGNANVDWNATATTVFGVSVVEGPITGTAGGIFDGLAEWTANVGNEAGMGIHATAAAYSLDGSGCAPATSTSPGTGTPKAVRGMYTTPGNGLNAVLAVNGRIEVAAGTSCANYATTFFEVGGRTAGTTTYDNRIFNGKIPEVIVYRSTLSPADNNKVESYLAIKYGLSLDQTAATNYVASDATVTWSAAANGIYKNNIAGIGRDDFSALLQKQSRSVNPGTQLAIGLGALDSTNLANANTFASNKSFLIWGDDNAPMAFKTAVTGNATVNYRMTRIWKVQETGTVGEVEVAGPYDALPNPQQTYLVVSADATFDGTDTYIPLYDITLNGKKHWAAKVDFTTGQYFTIAAFVKSPGGVGVTSLWVRADQGIDNTTDGASVDTWVDFGNEVNTATQTTTANQPVFMNNVTDNINYNPVVKFDGTDDFMSLDITKLPMGNTARTLIGVGKPTSFPHGMYILGYGNAATSQGNGLASNTTGIGILLGYNDDVSTAAGFWQANVTNEMFGTWAGAGGQANLYSKMLSVATPGNKSWNTTGTQARIGNSPWNNEQWAGPISEVIAFSRELTAVERQRVSTYLAIRHGYTINQTVPVNYLNTNGSVIWNATTNSAYRNNIAGIGRDDIEGLNQKQSKSIQAGAIVAIGLGNIATDNLANTSTFVSDMSYLVWGSNSTALTTGTTDIPARFSQRLTQEWKVSLSNFNNQLQPVAMEFNLTGITYAAGSAADFTLLIDTDGDGDFSTGTVLQVDADDYNSSTKTVSFNNITTLTTDAVFTLAIGAEALKLTTKVILQGAWNGTAMTTGLKTAGVLPATDPYGQSTTPAVSPNATAAQVVDWVLVELRDAANPVTVIASRAGFVLSNGNVVDTSYTQPLSFTGIANGMYKVAIRHRNHLGIMTLNDVDFSSGLGTADFTSSATATWGNNAQSSLTGGVMGMWAGNVNGDNSIRHSAKPSDVSEIAHAVLTHPGNTSASPTYTGFSNVYNVWDVNLDGKVLYTATPSDPAIIVNNVKTHPGNTFGLSSFIITQQLP